MSFEKDAFDHIKRLHLETKRHVDDLFAGTYRSIFKGEGIEFEEVREYEPGDDVRSIDWNVSARTQKLFVKRFREERELRLILVVDISASTHFGHEKKTKKELIAEVGALLAMTALKNQDKVGLLLVTSEIELYLKPKKGTRHLLRLIRELLYFKPKNKGTDLEKAIRFLGKVEKKRTICLMVSDFISPNFSRSIKIAAKKHELIACRVFDKLEHHFSEEGLFTLCDLETGQTVLADTTSHKVRQTFERKAKEEQKKLEKLFSSIGVSYFSLSTEDSPSNALYRFFKEHKRKQ